MSPNPARSASTEKRATRASHRPDSGGRTSKVPMGARYSGTGPTLVDGRSIPTTVCTVSRALLQAAGLALVALVKDEPGLTVAVSAGILTDDQPKRPADGGVPRYNHNLETSRSFFPSIVTTHTWEERFGTCQLVRDHGMELCCGVLLGMGESDEQRLELIGQVQQLDPAEVPVNFLNPRPGTPLSERPLVEPLEAIRWIALFRLALPAVILRYAGGREVTLRELQAMGMTAGINALIVGNYLTTLGRAPAEDLGPL